MYSIASPSNPCQRMQLLENSTNNNKEFKDKRNLTSFMNQEYNFPLTLQCSITT